MLNNKLNRKLNNRNLNNRNLNNNQLQYRGFDLKQNHGLEDKTGRKPERVI